MPSWERRSNTSQLSLPKTRTGGGPSSRASGRSSWVSPRTSADLPAPFGPRMAVCSSAAIVRVRPSRTGRSSLTTVALESSRTGTDKFPLSTFYLRRQRLAARFDREGQDQQTDEKRERGPGDRNAEAAVPRDPGAKDEHHRHADEPPGRADEGDRAAAAVGRVLLRQPQRVEGEVGAAEPEDEHQQEERRDRRD